MYQLKNENNLEREMCNLGVSLLVNFVGYLYPKLYVPMNARQTTKSLYIVMQQT